jgi:hypothetical protein
MGYMPSYPFPKGKRKHLSGIFANSNPLARRASKTEVQKKEWIYFLVSGRTEDEFISS